MFRFERNLGFYTGFFIIIFSNHIICNNEHNLKLITFNMTRGSDDHWEHFKGYYNKSYATRLHEKAAKKAWKLNLIHIDRHNQQNQSYTLRDNHLSDLTLNQYLNRVVKLVRADLREGHNETLRQLLENPDIAIPDRLDWRDFGFNPSAPNQRRCGACYAFSVSYAIEAQIFKLKKVLEPLSQQQMVDCSGIYGNYGCGGGSLRNALKYVKTFGLMKYSDYPYEAKKSPCRWQQKEVSAKIDGWGMITKGNEDELMKAVAIFGPIPVCLSAAQRTFQLYHDGIYDDIECSSTKVNHAVLVVGYTPDYWIILNWWSDHWGKHGYMYIRKGINRCGISNFAAFVVIR